MENGTSGLIEVEQIDFFGLQVPARKSARQAVVSDEGEFEVVHVTNVALGENPADGPHVVRIVYKGQDIVLGTLQKGLAHQFSVDFGVTTDVEFRNSGNSPIYLSGYVTRSRTVMAETESEEEEQEDEEMEEEESEEEEPPRAVPLAATGNGVPQRRAAAASAAAMKKKGKDTDMGREATAVDEPATPTEKGETGAGHHEPLVPGQVPTRKKKAERGQPPAEARHEPLVPMASRAALVAAARRRGVEPLVPEADEDEEDEDYDEDEDEDEEDEEEDEEAEDEAAQQRLARLMAGEGNEFPADEFESDEDEDEDEEGEDDDEEDGDDVAAAIARMGSDDIIGTFLEDEDEDEDEDEEEESEEEEEEEAVPPQQRGAKRPPSTPQVQQQKKQRTGEQRAPATAPAKVQQGGKGGAKGGPEGEFELGIVQHLRSAGAPVPLPVLGAKVKRPEGVTMKLKAFIVAHPKFKYDDKTQLVSLA